MAWEGKGEAYGFTLTAAMKTQLEKINYFATQHPDPLVRGDMRRAFDLAQQAIRDLVDGSRDVTKELGAQGGNDLRDCESTYVGTGREERDLGLQAYRLVTRRFPSPAPGEKPLMEIVYFGSRENARAYVGAAKTLGREGRGRLMDHELFVPIEPHPFAPVSGSEDPEMVASPGG